jgi:hypothetical protein
MEHTNAVLVLKQVAENYLWALPLLNELAQAKKPKTSTDVCRLRKRVNKHYALNLRKDLVDEFFMELQRVGLGRFKRSLGSGSHSSFEWSVFAPAKVLCSAVVRRSATFH